MAEGEKVQFVKIPRLSPEEYAEFTHEASMSEDPVLAAQARALKEIGPILHKWVKDESDRGTEPEHVVKASVAILANIIIAMAGQMARKGKELVVAAMILGDLNMIFKKTFTDLK